MPKIACGDLPKRSLNPCMKTFNLGNSASDNNPCGSHGRHESEDSMSQIPSLHLPCLVPGWQRGRLHAPAGGHRRAAGKSLKAVTMKGTHAGEPIARKSRNLQMPELRMERPVDKPAAGKNARADAGADGDVNDIRQSAGRA